MFTYPFGLNKLNIHSRSLKISGTAGCLKRHFWTLCSCIFSGSRQTVKRWLITGNKGILYAAKTHRNAGKPNKTITTTATATTTTTTTTTNSTCSGFAWAFHGYLSIRREQHQQTPQQVSCSGSSFFFIGGIYNIWICNMYVIIWLSNYADMMSYHISVSFELVISCTFPLGESSF